MRSVAQAEAELVRLEALKQNATQALADAKQRGNKTNIQIVIIGIGCVTILPIPYFIYLVGFKLTKIRREYKAADADLRRLEQDISAKRIEIADLRVDA